MYPDPNGESLQKRPFLVGIYGLNPQESLENNHGYTAGGTPNCPLRAGI